MPPPPRRRRPVQPATRVRLPRTARPRPHATPAGGTAEAGPEEITANGVEAPGAGTPSVGAGQTPVPAAPGSAAPGSAAPGSAAGVAEAGEARGGAGRAGAGRAGAGPAGVGGRTFDEADGEDAGEDVRRPRVAAGTRAGEREPLLLPVCLGVVAVALGGLAVWFGLKTGSSTGGAGGGFGAGAANVAVSNAAATAQVNQQIDNAVDTIFSYNYTDTAKTAQAAKSLLTGNASAQYATLFKVVEQEAPAEKLVLTTTVTNSGVEMLNAYSARLLIFANQEDTGASSKQTTAAGAMFAVTAVHQDGRWKIENINTFSSGG
jgi:Mce-associated membrane protein